MSDMQHGGALDRAIAEYGGRPEDWLDLSTGINPNPYPVPEIPNDVWQRLPDERLLADCLAAAREYYQVPDYMEIVAAPGTQAIIQLLPSVLDASEVAIASPTYNEHERCWAQHGAEVRKRSYLSYDGQAVVVVNPNNPTGMTYEISELEMAVSGLGKFYGQLIIDEAFADVAPEASFVPVMRLRATVLKSFGKFFGLAGLRLGFAIGSQEIIGQLRERLGPWAVSGPALYIGAKAMRDTDWIAQARIRLSGKRLCTERMICDRGFDIVGKTDLFVTASHAESAFIAKSLAQSHILVRTFDYAPTWIRFGLPADEAQFQRLAQALARATNAI